MLEYLMHQTKFLLRPDNYRPLLGSHPFGGPADSEHTALIVCGTGFKAHIPNAASTMRFGYGRAFARLGISYRLVAAHQLAAEIARASQPFVFLSEYDYEVMDRAGLRALRKVPHFVWIPASRRAMAIAYLEHGVSADEIRLPAAFAGRRLRDSGPNFLFFTSPMSAYQNFEQWHDAGILIESLPLACDDERYFPEDGNAKYKGAEMAFVGGYWRNKSFQFDKYLKPYADRLTVFGHSPWPHPYTSYGGLLPDNDERILYQNARLCPAISEPHAVITGDIVERVFKVAGSGGVAITDAIPHYRDIFRSDEILIPESLEHYHDLARRALNDDAFNERYRSAGIKAIRERHTYVHRARKVLNLLNIPFKAGVSEVANNADRCIT